MHDDDDDTFRSYLIMPFQLQRLIALNDIERCAQMLSG